MSGVVWATAVQSYGIFVNLVNKSLDFIKSFISHPLRNTLGLSIILQLLISKTITYIG